MELMAMMCSVDSKENSWKTGKPGENVGKREARLNGIQFTVTSNNKW